MRWTTHAAVALAGLVAGAPIALAWQSVRTPPREIWLRSAIPVRMETQREGERMIGEWVIRDALIDPDVYRAPAGDRTTWGLVPDAYPGVRGNLAGVDLQPPELLCLCERWTGREAPEAVYVLTGEVVTTQDATWCRLSLLHEGR